MAVMMTMMMTTMMMALIQLIMMNVLLLMIDDASMDTKSDDFAKSDGPTERRSDGPMDRQTQRLIGMRWTHPKRRIFFEIVLRPPPGVYTTTFVKLHLIEAHPLRERR